MVYSSNNVGIVGRSNHFEKVRDIVKISILEMALSRKSTILSTHSHRHFVV